MKGLPAWLRWIFAVTGGIFLFLYTTVLFVPTIEIQRLAARAIAPQGLTVSSTALGKAFPLGISGRGVTLANQNGALLKLDSLTLKLRLLPLFAGRVVLTCDAGIGSGTVKGEMELTRNGRVELLVKGLRLEEIPFFVTITGVQAKGELRINGTVQNLRAAATGSLRMEVNALDLSGVTISGTPLPDASYRMMQGMLRIAGGRMTLESMTLQGEGLFVRLKGDLPAVSTATAAPLNLTLEMMPKPEFMERQKFVFLLLAKYLTTPGHYQLPIRGTLANPQLQ